MSIMCTFDIPTTGWTSGDVPALGT